MAHRARDFYDQGPMELAESHDLDTFQVLLACLEDLMVDSQGVGLVDCDAR